MTWYDKFTNYFSEEEVGNSLKNIYDQAISHWNGFDVKNHLLENKLLYGAGLVYGVGLAALSALFLLKSYSKKNGDIVYPDSNSRSSPAFIRRKTDFAAIEATFSGAALKLQIDALSKKEHAKTFNIVFCIDTNEGANALNSSSSKNTKKEESAQSLGIKEGITNVLKKIKDILSKNKNLSFTLSIKVVGDSKKLFIDAIPITKETDLTETFKSIKETIFIEGTKQEINQGFESALCQLNKPKDDEQNVLILLTDRKDIHNFSINSHRQRLKENNISLYTVGMGMHDTKALESLVRQEDGFTGSYVKVESNQTKITESIDTIFQEIVPAPKFTLEMPSLLAGKWSAGRQKAVKKALKFDLGYLMQGQMKKFIKINTKALQEPLNLATVKLKLHATDPKGKTTIIDLPWQVSPVIDPNIAGKTGRNKNKEALKEG